VPLRHSYLQPVGGRKKVRAARALRRHHATTHAAVAAALAAPRRRRQQRYLSLKLDGSWGLPRSEGFRLWVVMLLSSSSSSQAFGRWWLAPALPTLRQPFSARLAQFAPGARHRRDSPGAASHNGARCRSPAPRCSTQSRARRKP